MSSLFAKYALKCTNEGTAANVEEVRIKAHTILWLADMTESLMKEESENQVAQIKEAALKEKDA